MFHSGRKPSPLFSQMLCKMQQAATTRGIMETSMSLFFRRHLQRPFSRVKAVSTTARAELRVQVKRRCSAVSWCSELYPFISHGFRGNDVSPMRWTGTSTPSHTTDFWKGQKNKTKKHSFRAATPLKSLLIHLQVPFTNNSLVCNKSKVSQRDVFKLFLLSRQQFKNSSSSVRNNKWSNKSSHLKLNQTTFEFSDYQNILQLHLEPGFCQTQHGTDI